MPIRFFTAVKCKLGFAVEKSYGQTRYYFCLSVSHITDFYVNVVGSCVASMLCFAATSKRSGSVRGKEIKNLSGTNKVSASQRRAILFNMLLIDILVFYPLIFSQRWRKHSNVKSINSFFFSYFIYISYFSKKDKCKFSRLWF